MVNDTPMLQKPVVTYILHIYTYYIIFEISQEFLRTFTLDFKFFTLQPMMIEWLKHVVYK
jgi:hypothetical protein